MTTSLRASQPAAAPSYKALAEDEKRLFGDLIQRLKSLGYQRLVYAPLISGSYTSSARACRYTEGTSAKVIELNVVRIPSRKPAAEILDILRTAVSTEQIDDLQDELVRIAPQSIPELQKAVAQRREPARVRAAALAALAPVLSREAMIPILLDTLKDKELAVRCAAAEAAGDMLPSDELAEALRGLAENDQSRLVRDVARDALRNS